MTNLPRFTGSLRAFAGITGSSDPYSQQRLHQELLWKRKCAGKDQGQGLSWNAIKNLAEKGTDKTKATKLTRELENVAKQFISEETDEDGVQESSAFLFNTFHDTDKVTSVESAKLRKSFGPYAASLSKKAFDIVQQLVNFLPEVASESLTDKSQKDSRKYFGQKIKVNLNFEDKDFEKLYGEFDESHSSNDHGDKFIQTFKNKLFTDNKNNECGAAAANGHEEQPKESEKNSFSSSWLYNVCSNHVNSNSCSLSTSELTSAIFDVISSSKSNDQIQNELFDLLGFEAFDLIQQLLEHRKDIIEAACGQQQQQNNDLNQEYQHIDPLRKRDKPLPGSQVTIQVRILLDDPLLDMFDPPMHNYYQNNFPFYDISSTHVLT